MIASDLVNKSVFKNEAKEVPPSEMMAASGDWLLIAALAAFKLALHFFTNTNYELHRDAFLYLAFADHLDWGYLSVPPSIAVFAKLTFFLFGDSVFAVRLFPALIGVASIIVIGMLVREFGGRKWALLFAGLAFILSPAFLRTNTLFQPVAFNQFYWLLSAYFIARMIKTQAPKYWIHLSVVWGLAFLNKYSIAFLILGFLISLLLTKDRKLLFSRYFGDGVIIGFAIVLFNLVWQNSHNWPAIWHLQELQRTQLVHVNFLDFFAMQLLMNLHAILLWLAGLAFLLFTKKGKQFRVLGFTFLTVMLILILLRGKPYYTLGMYSMLFAAGGVYFEKYFIARLRVLKPVLLGMMIISAIPIAPYSLPLLPLDKMADYGEFSKNFGLAGALRWEDGRMHRLPQDYADMTGWKELGDIVINAYHSLDDAEKANCAIYAENYGQAGAIKYYGKKHGLPEPISLAIAFCSGRRTALIFPRSFTSMTN